MSDRGTAFNIVNLVISLAALGVSVYSADQARRAVATSERMVPIVEEQVRPRLHFQEKKATLGADFVELTLNVKNAGTTGAAVNRLEVKLPSSPSALTQQFSDISNAILYIGDSRKSRLRLPRRIRPPGSEKEADLKDLEPGKFLFTISYEVYGKPQIAFEESVLFSGLKWTIESAKPPL